MTQIKHRGSVDQDFLSTLLELRRSFGAVLARAAPALSDGELDHQTQLWIDRLVYLRIAEDRGIELIDGFHTSDWVGASDEAVAKALTATVTTLCERRHGGLFDEHAIDTTALPSGPLAKTVRRFLQPVANYRLDAFPDDFLGTVYEWSMALGIQRIGAGVELVPCPERLRGSGTHYTPREVVTYMVRASLGRWLWEGPPPDAEERADPERMAKRSWRTVASVRKLRVIDPACGSGAFLLAALDCLLDWYLERARALGEKKPQEDFACGHDGQVVAAKPSLVARVIRDNLFGVDADDRALEVTRMSLYLRCLEGSRELFPEQFLPDLTANLRCGNSLVAPQDLPEDLDDATREAINAWDPKSRHGFPEVFEAGGFDVVLGNPPYVFGEFLNPVEKSVYQARYALGAEGQPDLYKLFFERCFTTFLKPGGAHAFVVTDALLARDDHADVRKFITDQAHLREVCHVGQVFLTLPVNNKAELGAPKDVGVSGVVVISQRRGRGVKGSPVRVTCWENDEPTPGWDLAEDLLVSTDGQPWFIAAPQRWFGPEGLRRRLDGSGCRLANLLRKGAAGSTRGEETGKKHLRGRTAPIPRGFRAIYAGEDVARLNLGAPGKIVDKTQVKKNSAYYEGPKILFVKTGAGPVAAACDDDHPLLQSAYTLHLEDGLAIGEDAVVGVLCSALVTAYAYYRWTFGKKLLPQFTLGEVRELPFPKLDGRTIPLLRKVGQQVARARKALRGADTAARPSTQRQLRERAEQAERTIDELVAQAFGLDLESWLEVLRPALEQLPATQRPRWWT